MLRGAWRCVRKGVRGGFTGEWKRREYFFGGVWRSGQDAIKGSSIGEGSEGM